MVIFISLLNHTHASWHFRIICLWTQSQHKTGKLSIPSLDRCCRFYEQFSLLTVAVLGSTQTKDGTSLKEVKIRLTQTHLAVTRLAVLRKDNTISFHTKIQVTGLVNTALRMWKLNVVGGSGETNPGLTYRTESIKQTSMCGIRSTSSPDVRSFYCQPSNVAS